jgi:hypothetical protein
VGAPRQQRIDNGSPVTPRQRTRTRSRSSATDE